MTLARPLPEAPSSPFAGNQWQLGVYRTPFAAIDMSATGWKRYRLKEWHYVSFTTDEWFVAVGLVQAGYIANLFSYAVDRVQSTPAIEYGSLSPLGKALSFAGPYSRFYCRTSWNSFGKGVLSQSPRRSWR